MDLLVGKGYLVEGQNRYPLGITADKWSEQTINVKALRC